MLGRENRETTDSEGVCGRGRILSPGLLESLLTCTRPGKEEWLPGAWPFLLQDPLSSGESPYWTARAVSRDPEGLHFSRRQPGIAQKTNSSEAPWRSPELVDQAPNKAGDSWRDGDGLVWTEGQARTTGVDYTLDVVTRQSHREEIAFLWMS